MPSSVTIPPSSVASTVTLAGDVTGDSDANTVEQIQGQPVSSAAPSADDVLAWDGAQYAPTAVVATMGGDISGDSDAAVVDAIQGEPVDATAPSLGDVLYYDGDSWSVAPFPIVEVQRCTFYSLDSSGEWVYPDDPGSYDQTNERTGGLSNTEWTNAVAGSTTAPTAYPDPNTADGFCVLESGTYNITAVLRVISETASTGTANLGLAIVGPDGTHVADYEATALNYDDSQYVAITLTASSVVLDETSVIVPFIYLNLAESYGQVTIRFTKVA